MAGEDFGPAMCGFHFWGEMRVGVCWAEYEI